MMTYGSGIASPPEVDGDIWNIFDGNDRVAIFDHTGARDIQAGAPVFFSLPLGPGGLADKVLLQSAVDALVELAIPPNGATDRARERLQAIVIDAHARLPDDARNQTLALARLRQDLVSFRDAAAATNGQRLILRQLPPSPASSPEG